MKRIFTRLLVSEWNNSDQRQPRTRIGDPRHVERFSFRAAARFLALRLRGRNLKETILRARRNALNLLAT